MFYESLFNPSIHRPVKACLTGAGEFGASFLFQAQGMPLLEVPAVCTRTVQRAVDAYENAGIPASKVRVCESAEDAKKAYADGFNVVVDSFEYIADLPLDVLVESSGAPEASAAAAELAIERGMHVVMVSKETDSVVGSILARKAAERGIAPAERLHDGIVLSPDEISLVKALADYPATVIQAAENFSPAVIANYLYELSKQYNGYYHDIPILRESDPTVQAVRLRLSQTVAEVIASGAGLLGINVPERM